MTSTPLTSAIMILATKILIVGLWQWPWYQQACADALESLGCQIAKFDCFHDFYSWAPERVEPVYRSFSARAQNRLLVGPKIWAINERLLAEAKGFRPDIIWFYNCVHIWPRTVRRLRFLLPETYLVQYANDDPFSRHLRPDIWRHLKRALPEFDLHFVYRKANEEALKRLGAQKVYLMRSYYMPKEDYKVELNHNDDRFRCDVVFAGHFESDGRVSKLEAIASAGAQVNLFGGGWFQVEQGLETGSPLRKLFPVSPVLGEDYRKAISGSKIALCFLSKINSDTYTRRNFQIPAMRTFMLSEYSDDLTEMFKEGKEAEYFRSTEELVDKVRFYLAHDSARDQIALRGYERVLADGHDVVSRMREFLRIILFERNPTDLPGNN